jgi:hypothetical protein
MDRWGFFIIVLLALLCVACGYSLICDKNPMVMTEGMAPLNEGTYDNPYPRGRCNRGSFKRHECEVGTCPLGTTVSDTRYCGIQCAQELNRKDRKRCEKHCMNMMVGCH